MLPTNTLPEEHGMCVFDSLFFVVVTLPYRGWYRHITAKKDVLPVRDVTVVSDIFFSIGVREVSAATTVLCVLFLI